MTDDGRRRNNRFTADLALMKQKGLFPLSICYLFYGMIKCFLNRSLNAAIQLLQEE